MMATVAASGMGASHDTCCSFTLFLDQLFLYFIFCLVACTGSLVAMHRTWPPRALPDTSERICTLARLGRETGIGNMCSGFRFRGVKDAVRVVSLGGHLSGEGT